MAMRFTEIAPKGSAYTIQEIDTLETQHIKLGYDAEITQTWDGKKVDHEPIRIHMRWHFERQHGKPHKRVVRVNLEAPLFDEDEEPNDFSGICPGLWNYECVELFFANQKGHYVEVEVGPHGHWLVLLHKGYRDCFNKGEELELEVRNEFQGSTWRCTFEIPLAYFPGGVRRFNAYALHTVDGVRHYEALHTVTDGGLAEPDFHKLEYFGPIDFRRVVPEGYNRHPFNDIKYGDLWESVNPKKTEEE